MEFFFFDPITFDRFYNCTFYDVQTIPLDQRQKPVIGALTIALGIIMMCVYLPCLFAISRPKLIRQQCYQLMFFLGIVNVTQICTCTLFTGLFAIFGTVFCSQPYIMYWLGAIASSLFFTELMTSCCLALNRLFTFHNALLADRFFDGLKTIFWILFFLVLTFLISFWNPPHIYNPIVNSFVQNPHYGYKAMDEEFEAFYAPLWPRYCSVALLCLTIVIYSVFLVTYFSKRKQRIGTTTSAQIDKNIFIQVLWISLISFIVSMAYTFDWIVLNLSFGSYLVPFYTYGYVLHQGSPAVIYLLLNKTIRRQLNLGKTSVVHLAVVKPFPNLMFVSTKWRISTRNVGQTKA